MRTTLTIQSSLAFLGGIAAGSLASVGSAMALSSLMLLAAPTEVQACLMTIPTEAKADSQQPSRSIRCGVRPF